MAKTNKRKLLMLVIGILFIMAITPGEGSKIDASTQAIVATDYICSSSSDCPTCVLGGIVEDNATESTFLGELSESQCIESVCQLSDACLVWDCGTNQVDCNSVKQTFLDNTIGRLQDNPGMLLFIIGGVIVFLML